MAAAVLAEAELQQTGSNLKVKLMQYKQLFKRTVK
jgi:hypothetical protein